MKKCMIFGNCQVRAIKQYLEASKTFKKNYKEIVLFLPHSGEPMNENLLQDLDLLIYQNVGNSFGQQLSSDYVLNHIPDSCQTVSITKAYFKGYHPQFGANPTIKPDTKYSNKPSGIFPYGDSNIHKLLGQHKTKEEIIRMISDRDYYSKDEAQSNYEQTIQELIDREVGVDVSIAQYIIDHFQKHHLFYSINHPSYSIIREISMGILNQIGIHSKEIKRTKIDSFGKTLQIPIYPSVIKHLNLQCVHEKTRYSFYLDRGGSKITFGEYASRYIDHATL